MDVEHQRSTAQASEPATPTQRAEDIGAFECNICYEVAREPVVTLCGHLYCWPCIYRWVRTVILPGNFRSLSSLSGMPDFRRRHLRLLLQVDASSDSLSTVSAMQSWYRGGKGVLL